MAPVSRALQVTLSDGTKLHIDRDGYKQAILEIEPSERFQIRLTEEIEKHLHLFEDHPLDRDDASKAILKEHILPHLRLFAFGESERTPQYKSGEIVALVVKDPPAKKFTLLAGTIESLYRS